MFIPIQALLSEIRLFRGLFWNISSVNRLRASANLCGTLSYIVVVRMHVGIKFSLEVYARIATPWPPASCRPSYSTGLVGRAQGPKPQRPQNSPCVIIHLVILSMSLSIMSIVELYSA